MGFKKAKMKMDFAASSNFLTELEIVAKCEAFFEDSSAFKIVEKWGMENWSSSERIFTLFHNACENTIFYNISQ